MQWRYAFVYRGFMVLLLLTLFWSVWSSAQVSNSASSQPAADGTNAPAAAPLPKLPLNLGVTAEELSFGLDRIPLLRDTQVLGEPLWKYFASLIFIVLAFYVSKFLDYTINRWLRKLAERTETRYDDLLLELLHGPVKVVSFVILLHVGLNLFDWPGYARLWLSRALILVVAGSLTYVGIKLVDMLVGLWLERVSAETDQAFQQQLVPVIRKCLKAFVVIIGILLTASNLEINVTGLLASLSIGGLAIGLAAQDTLANLFGAVAVYLDRPFQVGHRIKLDQVDGTVEYIGLRSTRVRNLDGHLVTIPNKTVANAIITNIAARPNIKTEMNIGLAYDTPAGKVQRATEMLGEIFQAHPKTLDLVIAFNRFDSSSLNIQVLHWWNGTDFKTFTKDLQALNLQVKERFDAEGISFAFPTQTVYVRQDSEWQLTPQRGADPGEG